MNADKNVQEFVTTKIWTKDQLPEVGEKVIVLDEHGDIDDVAWICEYPDGTKKWTDGEMGYSIDCFKSWMPPPKPKCITIKDAKVTFGGAELKDFGPEVNSENF